MNRLVDWWRRPWWRRFRHAILLAAVALTVGCSRSGNAPPPRVDVANLRSQAEQGDPDAQAALGRLYLKGDQVKLDYAEAAKWFKLAAQKENPDALAGLGELYESGQGGVKQDMDLAVKCYRQAAEEGHAGAQYTLGFMAECGRGLPQNHTEAAKWFLLAARQGEPLSQYDLGQRYELGVGVPVDLVESLKWFTLAARQNQADAEIRRKQVRGKMTSEQISEADRRVSDFKPEENLKP